MTTMIKFSSAGKKDLYYTVERAQSFLRKFLPDDTVDLFLLGTHSISFSVDPNEPRVTAKRVEAELN